MAGLWAGAGQSGVHVHVAQLCESEGQGIRQISFSFFLFSKAELVL